MERHRSLCVIQAPPGAAKTDPHDVVLRLVCQPGPGPVPILKRSPGVLDPFFIGGGNENLLCGNCDHLLALHVDREQLPRLVFSCPQCGYFCDTD